ncbi:phosphoglucomutase [Keratinibaculum paraultunense]|uniref:Phosphoglucomutase n=1 Tax=Keratinibaculum paraultunense TaxID=1278232 RepID=A0A4R3KSS7_9FIRM|nr:phospho-sugar mutase [Keratinibaculum paraultunense]QQY78811.1 phospho-sugar mutase [Keratinibaculum paraultunense]TCS87479.1 phosphoglucomutase [Keratinibaculum paraultunense]
MDYLEKYNYWLSSEYFDEDTKKELESIRDNEEEILDRFHTNLTFGTAGMRGKIGAGTNRMNKYTVSLATQGLAETIKARGKDAMKRGVAIAYDVRHFSKEFAEITASVLAANGIKVYLFDDIRPTPLLSYTIRKLGTISGVVITASHNPKDYNGYKVYWEEGSQILDDIAEEILNNINAIGDFSNVKFMDLEEGLNKALINYIGKEIDDEYIEDVKSLALNEDIDKDIKIVYTPLNGTGNKPVRRVLRERGFENVFVVPEQENPDPDFTTVGYPNPEDIKAFDYAIRLGKEKNADLLIATDPDCDRVACMVKDFNGEYVALNGNQTGALLVKYILSSRHRDGTIPKNGAIVKSIVTGDLGKAIAKEYNVATIETLTGFKNICGKANEFDKTGEYTFIMGYEESIGYVYGTIVRDKDGVISSMLIAEMTAYYKKQGKTLLDELNEIYKKYGYYFEKLISIVLEGVEGQERINRIMDSFREDPIRNIGDMKLMKIIDYLNDETGNPKSNVLKYYFDDGSWYAIRPSGTEPKVKVYIYSKDKEKQASKNKIKAIEKATMDRIESIK